MPYHRTTKQPPVKYVDLEVFQMRGRWYVRPAGTLGTCGFYPIPWEIHHIPYVRSASKALEKARETVPWAKQPITGDRG